MTIKIVSILILLISGFNATSNQIQKQDDDQYCNARFDYCVEYPDFLNPQPESQNGDGRIFNNKKEEAVLKVFGRLNLDAEGETISLEQQFKTDIQDNLKKNNVVTYKKLGKTFFVISGLRDGKIFYQKTILKKDAFAFAILEYHKEEKETFDKISTQVFKSFR